MRSCRGPGFAMRAGSGFIDGKTAAPPPEPSAEELASVVDGYYAAMSNAGSMGESDAGVVFQGEGDPLEAAHVVLDTVALVAERRNGVKFRLNTLGLVDPQTVELLLASPVLARGDADMRRETRLQSVSVFMPATCPSQYAELLGPRDGLGFKDVCAFVASMAEAGVEIECTTVARPDVSVADVEALAMALGAQKFRVRSYHPDEGQHQTSSSSSGGGAAAAAADAGEGSSLPV